MEIRKAARQQVKLKLNLSSPSGAGKTMGALLMAKGLVGGWEKIILIDTENNSASLYSHLGAFNVLDLQPPFSPERYIEAIDACLKAGAECIIIDSASHEWSGIGGCVEYNEKIAQSKFKGNTWSAWSQTTPKHDSFVNKILQSNCHVITCTRSKSETVMGEDKKVKKIGMKDIQRENWEYELTVSLSLDRDTHMAIASKDRTNIFEGKDPFIITEETGKMILDWCNSGSSSAPIGKPSGNPNLKDVYMAFLEGNKAKLQSGEAEKFTKGIDTWDAATFDKAIDRVKGIFAKREQELMHAEEGKNK